MTQRGNGEAPAVSVVVPARNAAATMPQLLAALGRSTFVGRWELVVVDDVSVDGTGEQAEEWGAKVIRLQRQSGAAAARNAGVAGSAAPLIAFTDADCEPSPGWLSALVESLGGADLVIGPVEPVPGTAMGPFDRTLWVSRGSPLFETANLSVRREIIERVGGFRPFVGTPGDSSAGLRPTADQRPLGEDVVFGWRARRAGARVAFSERALVHHAVFAGGAREFVAERWRRRFFPALVREIPELRRHLPWGVFLARQTAAFDLAAAGMALGLATGRRWPVLFAVPYLTRYVGWRELMRWRTLVFLAADGVSLAALVRGSIAARRLLL